MGISINNKLNEKSKTKPLTIIDIIHSYLHTMNYMHCFFYRESLSFMEGYSKWYYWLNYPKAYIGFMSISYKNWRTWIKSIKDDYKSSKLYKRKAKLNRLLNK